MKSLRLKGLGLNLGVEKSGVEMSFNPRLEVFGEDGTRLFDFWATESSLKINGDFLEPTDENIKLPYKVPRVHAARNIGPETYHEILFESKFSGEDLNNPTRLSKKEL